MSGPGERLCGCSFLVPGVLFLVGWLCSVPTPGRAQTPVSEWMLAGPYPAERVNREAYPSFYSIFLAPWREIEAGPGGTVDLNLQVSRENPQGDLVIARHVFRSDTERVVDLEIGFAGEVDVFFDRLRVFSGRRPGAMPRGEPMGELGSPDRVPLYVKKGLNEIFLMASSRGEPWAFRAGTTEPLAPKIRAHELATELWATPDTFLTSESVLKDPSRPLLYVSSFDNEYAQKPEPSGYISRLSLDGEILEHRWVDGLHAPTGMDAWMDTLYVAEREHVLAIDMASGEVAGRWAIPDPVFPNDLVIDGEGTVYISDTRTGNWPDSRIYRFKDGRFDIFANEGINGANGLWIHDGWLIVGSSGDGLLKRVELSTGRMETIISLGAGIIDGIRVDPRGNYLVSHWEGQLYRIDPGGEVVEILDALPQGWNTADFEYLPEEGLILIPTFLDNRVRAIRIRG
ncbi:MAG: SMP-30/gluconolactonase/LRE family protein [Gemmatimonadota bacterium]|jgi:sugar lactone lactonase YvrE